MNSQGQGRRVKRRIRTDKRRTEWGSEHDWCFLCGSGYGLETHEIIPRSVSPASFYEPWNWLRLCNVWQYGCHERMPVTDKAVQVALKRIADPEHYRLKPFQERYGIRSVTRIQRWLEREAFESAPPERAIELVVEVNARVKNGETLTLGAARA